MLAFLTLVLSIAAWAALGGGAGTQRGLVIRNQTAMIADVTLADGQTARIDREDNGTFIARREDYPSTIRVESIDGGLILEREVTYDFLAGAKFRISFDENGFFPTTVVRATPVRGTTTP